MVLDPALESVSCLWFDPLHQIRHQARVLLILVDGGLENAGLHQQSMSRNGGIIRPNPFQIEDRFSDNSWISSIITVWSITFHSTLHQILGPLPVTHHAFLSLHVAKIRIPEPCGWSWIRPTESGSHRAPSRGARKRTARSDHHPKAERIPSSSTKPPILGCPTLLVLVASIVSLTWATHHIAMDLGGRIYHLQLVCFKEHDSGNIHKQNLIKSDWWFQPPWKIWARQLGLWNSQSMEKHVPNHQPEMIEKGYTGDVDQ